MFLGLKIPGFKLNPLQKQFPAFFNILSLPPQNLNPVSHIFMNVFASVLAFHASLVWEYLKYYIIIGLRKPI